MAHGHGHGPLGSVSKAEPNLTPLLDIVLQLLMFFMMCINFVGEQSSPLIKLPRSDSAVPVNKAGTPEDVLFLNLTAEGLERDAESGQMKKTEPQVLVVGETPWALSRAGRKLRDKYNDSVKSAKTKVVIRPHKDARYEHLWFLLRCCKDAGYQDLLIRAEVDAAASPGSGN